MPEGHEHMNTGGFAGTVLVTAVSTIAALLGGSLEAVREFVGHLTQAQATLAVGLFAAVFSAGVRELGVYLRWRAEQRRRQ